MAAACIVLNGPSCSGKSSIAAALQERWPRPLQSTGIDTFLASQSERFFAIDGTLTDGVSWVPTTVDGMPAFDIVPGELGLGMIRASHSFWSSCVEAGLDQVIDDVWVIPEQPTGLERALSRATVLWVGVHCPLPIIVQREQDRGDRPVGAARGHYRLTHSFRDYDVTVDTSSATPDACAALIVDRFRERFPAWP